MPFWAPWRRVATGFNPPTFSTRVQSSSPEWFYLAMPWECATLTAPLDWLPPSSMQGWPGTCCARSLTSTTTAPWWICTDSWLWRGEARISVQTCHPTRSAILLGLPTVSWDKIMRNNLSLKQDGCPPLSFKRQGSHVLDTGNMRLVTKVVIPISFGHTRALYDLPAFNTLKCLYSLEIIVFCLLVRLSVGTSLSGFLSKDLQYIYLVDTYFQAT